MPPQKMSWKEGLSNGMADGGNPWGQGGSPKRNQAYSACSRHQAGTNEASDALARRAVNMISILLAIVDCVSSASMSVAAALGGTKEADALNDAVFFVELAALLGEKHGDARTV